MTDILNGSGPENRNLKVEKDIFDRNEKYRLMVEHANEMILVAQDGLIRFINQKVLDFLGYRPEELQDRPFSDHIHPDDRETVTVRHIRRMKGEDLPGIYPFRIVDRNGKIRWVEVNAVRIEWEKKPATLSYLSDISGRRQAEEKLRESEEKHRHLYTLVRLMTDTMPDMVWAKNLDKEYIFANKAICRKLLNATDTSEPLGRTDMYFAQRERDTHPENPSWHTFGELCRDSDSLTFREMKPMQFDEFGNVKGKFLQLDVHKAPLFDAGGKLIGVVGSARDVTARKQAEQHFEMLFHKMLDGFAHHEIICDTTGKPMDYRFLAVNPAFERMTGLRAVDITGKTVLEVLPGTETYWIDTYGKVALTGEPAFFKNYAADINKHFEVTAFRPAPGQFACIFQDITELKKMETQLRQSQKMESIGTLAGGIAHDFNNILFPIVGHTEMLLDDIPGDGAVRNSLVEIYTAALRARDLVKQILSFARQGESEPRLMKMQPVIKEVLKLIRSTIPTTISIFQDVRPDCGIVRADPTQIHQIIMNLATNAWHAMEHTGGELKFTLKETGPDHYGELPPGLEPGSYACLTVSDTGQGIDPAIMNKIFDPFFTTKGKGMGTGMGLAVIHGIVKHLKGAVRVYSEPGKGTEFRVYLPIVKSSFEPEDIFSEDPLPGGIERILLVDDETAILGMERTILERLGYHVTSMPGSIEALDAFRTGPEMFDLVITDLAMPEMPGDRLAAELTRIRPDIPILLCTGFSERMSDEKIRTMGIRGLLMKPVVLRDLARKIREVLD